MVTYSGVRTSSAPGWSDVSGSGTRVTSPSGVIRYGDLNYGFCISTDEGGPKIKMRDFMYIRIVKVQLEKNHLNELATIVNDSC